MLRNVYWGGGMGSERPYLGNGESCQHFIGSLDDVKTAGRAA
jgi:hypothetical protein